MSILQTVCQHLQAENWAYNLDEAREMAVFDVAGERGTLSCFLVADEKLQCLSIFTEIGVTIPSIKRLRMSDFIARVNYSLLLGCFELNPENGEIHFRVSLPLSEAELSRQQLRDLISSSIDAVNRYYQGVMMIIYRNITALEAVQKCEYAQ